jgi:hypothetical protein
LEYLKIFQYSLYLLISWDLFPFYLPELDLDNLLITGLYYQELDLLYSVCRGVVVLKYAQIKVKDKRVVIM